MKISKYFCLMTVSLVCLSSAVYATEAEDIGFGGGGEIKASFSGLQGRDGNQYDKMFGLSASVPVYNAKSGDCFARYSVSGAIDSQEERLSIVPNTLQLYDARVAAGAVITNIKSREMYMFHLGLSAAEEKDVLSDVQERVSFLGMGTYRSRPNLVYIYGAGYSYIFGRGRLFPAFGFNWKIDEKRSLNFFLPLQVRYSVKVSTVLKASLYSVLFGNQYRFKNQAMYPGQPDILYLHTVGIKLGLGAEYKAFPGWALGADIGTVLRRDADISQDGTDEIAQEKMNGEFFFQASCKWSFGGRAQTVSRW
jgi:hypothetical protein